MERQGQQPRPSARAAERLTDGVGRELGSLRRSLTDALAEAERLEQAGRTDLAVDVLEEQRLVLARVHDQLMGHVSAAAVEREAESIVAAVEPTTLDLTELAAPSQTPARVVASTGDDVADEQDERDDHVDVVGAGEPDRRSLAGRVLVSALAAVLGLVLLATPEPEAGRLTIAGRPAADTGDAPSTETDIETETEPGTDPHASQSGAAEAAPTAVAPATVTDEVRAVHGPLPTLTTPAVAASTTADVPGVDTPAAPSDGSKDDEDTDQDLEVPTDRDALEDRLDAVVPDPDTR